MARPGSPLPSPASANSSSTLIVSPLVLASKADTHLPPFAPNAMSLPTAMLGMIGDSGVVPHAGIAETTNNDTNATSAFTAATVTPIHTPIPTHPSAPGRPPAGLRLASRQSAPTPAQTRMSERGFVEPHHSNVPRRARTLRAKNSDAHTHTQADEHAHIPTSKDEGRPRAASASHPAPVETPGGSPTSPVFVRGRVPPLDLAAEDRDKREEREEREEEEQQLVTPLDTPNPNAARMPERLLSLRLPPSPTTAAAASPPPIGMSLLPQSYPRTPPPRAYTPNAPARDTPSPGLPTASSVPHAPRAGLPQGIGLGFGTPLGSAAIVPGTPRPGTPGSGRLPVRRRRTGTGVGVGGGEKKGGVDSSQKGAETPTPTPGPREGFTLSPAPPPLPARRPHPHPHPAPQPLASDADEPAPPSDETPHGPVSFRAHRARLRAERRERMGVQRVGRGSGVEVGFGEGAAVWEGVLGEEGGEGVSLLALREGDGEAEVFEEVALDGVETSGVGRVGVEEGEDKEKEKGKDAEEKVTTQQALHVLLYEVDSSSDSESESDGGWPYSSSSEEGSEGRLLRPPHQRERRELRLALPADRRALVDGACALGAAQLREACAFIGGVLGDAAGSPSTSAFAYTTTATAFASTATCTTTFTAATTSTSTTTFAATSAMISTLTSARVLPPPTTTTRAAERRRRVRILAPRGRPEDAMGVAVAYLAYGAALAATAAERVTNTSADGPSATPSDPFDSLATATADAPPQPTALDDEEEGRTHEAAPPPGAAHLIAQMESPPVLGAIPPHAGSSLPPPHARSLVPAPLPPMLAFAPDTDAHHIHDGVYTPAHHIAMRLLDDGEWLARGPGAAVGGGSGLGLDGGVLGAGRGVRGVVHLGRGVGGVDVPLGADDDEEEEDGDSEEAEEGEMDEEGTAGSTAGSSAPARGGGGAARSSAGAHAGSADADAVAERLREAEQDGQEDEQDRDADAREERRGRTVAWHGVPMPPKYVEDADGASPSPSPAPTPPPVVGADPETKAKPASKSKSKSRARARSKSQRRLPSALLLGDADNSHSNSNNHENAIDTANATARRQAAREARRAARRAAEEEAYAGLADAWRGVLSYDGLAALGAVLHARGC